MTKTLNTIVPTVLVVVIALNAGSIYGNKRAQQSVDNDKVKEELTLGSRAYNEGDFKLAEEHFKLAKTADPNNKRASLFYAQAINAQLPSAIGSTLIPKPPRIAGERETPVDAIDPVESANDLMAKRAITAFQDALSLDPQNPVIYLFIAHIFDLMGNTEQQQKWLIDLASLANLDPQTRCETYYSLAVFKWQYTFPITTRWTDLRKGSQRADKPTYHIYLRSDFPAAERAKAERQTAEGLDYINKALAIDPDYANAYSYRALLHREQAKLANNPADKMKYLRDYETAIAKFRELTDKLKR